MGLFSLKINGVRYTHAQARLYVQRLEEEIDTLNNEVEARIKQVDDLSAQLSVARNLYAKAQKELAKWKPQRDKRGRFLDR